jgi:thiamine-phosphate pyrophosphorylase
LLPGKLLFDLSKEVVGVLENTRALVLINDRPDVALAAGADGVHLPEASMSPSIVRRAFGKDLVIGVSTHSVEAAIETSKSGADYLFFGPIFLTPGKGNPVGLDELGNVCDGVGSFPVIALGGIDETNAQRVFATGAAGIAAIRSLHERDSRRSICKSAEAFKPALG